MVVAMPPYHCRRAFRQLAAAITPPFAAMICWRLRWYSRCFAGHAIFGSYCRLFTLLYISRHFQLLRWLLPLIRFRWAFAVIFDTLFQYRHAAYYCCATYCFLFSLRQLLILRCGFTLPSPFRLIIAVFAASSLRHLSLFFAYAMIYCFLFITPLAKIRFLSLITPCHTFHCRLLAAAITLLSLMSHYAFARHFAAFAFCRPPLRYAADISRYYDASILPPFRRHYFADCLRFHSFQPLSRCRFSCFLWCHACRFLLLLPAPCLLFAMIVDAYFAASLFAGVAAAALFSYAIIITLLSFRYCFIISATIDFHTFDDAFMPLPPFSLFSLFRYFHWFSPLLSPYMPILYYYDAFASWLRFRQYFSPLMTPDATMRCFLSLHGRFSLFHYLRFSAFFHIAIIFILSLFSLLFH